MSKETRERVETILEKSEGVTTGYYGRRARVGARVSEFSCKREEN